MIQCDPVLQTINILLLHFNRLHAVINAPCSVTLDSITYYQYIVQIVEYFSTLGYIALYLTQGQSHDIYNLLAMFKKCPWLKNKSLIRHTFVV